MRPVTKNLWPQVNGAPKSYNPHQIARPDLEANLDRFCSYCEVFSSDLEVEHVISRTQNTALSHNWDNFLLACGRCNGADNKSNKPVNVSVTHFPHISNTFISFVYKEGGLVEVNPALNANSRRKAERLMNLVGLDKFPGNPKYPNLNPNDTRWDHRRIAWEWAKRKLPDYLAGRLTAQDIVDLAYQRGFFSIWFSVYSAYEPVRRLLVQTFLGTAQNCFEPITFIPRHRNPHRPTDPV